MFMQGNIGVVGTYFENLHIEKKKVDSHQPSASGHQRLVWQVGRRNNQVLPTPAD